MEIESDKVDEKGTKKFQSYYSPALRGDTKLYEDTPESHHRKMVGRAKQVLAGIEERPENIEYTYENGEENLSDELNSDERHQSREMRHYDFSPNACWISSKSNRIL